jgi:hypothetical protein
VKVIRTAVLATVAAWAGKRLLARRKRHPEEPVVEVGGDGAQTEPPVGGAGGD